MDYDPFANDNEYYMDDSDINHLDMDDPDMFDYSSAFEETQKVEMENGDIFYKKLHNDLNLDKWNELYGFKGKLLKLNLEAFNGEDGYDYFPELGEEVQENSNKCFEAYKQAYEKLLRIGYKHVDLFDEKTNWYNCTNVRKLNGKYYPIDVSKIYPINYGGKKNKSKKNKSKKNKTNKKLKY